MDGVRRHVLDAYANAVRLAAWSVVAASIAACGSPPDRPRATSATAEQRYRTTTTVLESKEHGPMLCLGGVAESLPPQCGDVPISNWNWDDVDDKESMSGTTWGEYDVVGTYDGATFTLTERPRPATRPSPSPFVFRPGCDSPKRGNDPSRDTDADRQAAARLARRAEDFAGLWRAGQVLNVAFTGDIERHERELRSVWGGLLCVVRFERAYADLERAQRALVDMRDELRLLSVGISENRNIVDLTVILMSDEQKRTLENRYGRGTIIVTERLQPAGA